MTNMFFNFGRNKIESSNFKNCHFMTISAHFFGNYINIFHKTEIQTVNLRCLRSLNLNWYKIYDKKHKNAKNTKDENLGFCTELQKKKKWKYFRFLPKILNQ